MFIRDLTCISPQYTYDGGFWNKSPEIYTNNEYLAKEPDYTQFISKGVLRRMSKATRMGLGTSLPLLRKHNDIEGVIIGTADGGIQDSMKFLSQVVEYEEGTLSPTSFAQSTPNSLAGQLAITSKNSGYNSTHVNKGLAFESALLDAKLMLDEGEVSTLLLGCTDQFSTENYQIEDLGGYLKKDAVPSDRLLDSLTEGTVNGEGSTMFILDSCRKNSLAHIADVDQISHPTEEKLNQKLSMFLERNGLDITNIDAIVLGLNGDVRTDFWYHEMANRYQGPTLYSYKNLIGEYPTSMGYAVWLATHILNGKQVCKSSVRRGKQIDHKNILIYNHYKGKQHGFVLMKR